MTQSISTTRNFYNNIETNSPKILKMPLGGMMRFGTSPTLSPMKVRNLSAQQFGRSGLLVVCGPSALIMPSLIKKQG